VPSTVCCYSCHVKFFALPNAADWRKPSVIALIAANLVPLAGVLWFGWEVFPLMFLFWSENVIVGAFNVLKMIFASGGGAAGQASKIFIIPFFCVHYGMFTFGHGIFIMAMFGGGMGNGMGFPGPGTFWRAMQENHLGWAVLGLIISRGISFATNYIGNGEYKNVLAPMLMAQPYGRIMVLHLAIIGGGFLVMALHSPLLGLLLLVVLKTLLDLAGHLRERAKFSAAIAVKAD
jgi:hypothetical protein